MQVVVKETGMPVIVKSVDADGYCSCKIGKLWMTYHLRDLALTIPGLNKHKDLSIPIVRSSDYMIYILANNWKDARLLANNLKIPEARYKYVSKPSDVKGATGRPYIVAPMFKHDVSISLAVAAEQMREIVYELPRD